MTNASEAELKVYDCAMLDYNGIAEESRYLPRGGKRYVYKPISDEVAEVESIEGTLVFSDGGSITIALGKSHTFTA